MAGVLKVVFLFTIFGHELTDSSNMFAIIGMALLVGGCDGRSAKRRDDRRTAYLFGLWLFASTGRNIAYYQCYCGYSRYITQFYRQCGGSCVSSTTDRRKRMGEKEVTVNIMEFLIIFA